ncbi:MAG: hypothetical protein LQ352_005326, partial [Teloschistes flavicans]
MSAEAEFSEQFYESSKKFFSERVDYASVTALLLYWEENDVHPETEVDTIRELFERDFGFSSLTFLIPARRAQQELNREISAFVSNYSNNIDSLILVYYAGHGDVDNDGKSVWAAAALVVKGDRHGHKFEMLGASAKGRRTPEPGRSSFTSILIKHVRRSLKKAQQINARGLHGELLEDSKLTETPQYADLTGSSPRSIVLQPLKPLEHEGFVKKPGSFLLLKVSLAEDPTGSRIADWLKSYAPEGVTAVSVEALILKARRLQGLVNQSAFPPGSTFGRLSEGAKTEILRQLQGLNTVLYSADQLSAQTTVSSAEAPLAADSIQAIDQSVEAVCKAVEAPLLLDEPCAGIEEMDQASGDAAAIVGAEEAMSLRRQILNIAVIPGHLELPRDVLHLPRNWKNSQGTIVYERFRSGTFGVGMNQLDILVESFEVEESDDTDVEQIEKKAALLRQTKRASFHILPCIGYISEPLSHTFGFVFERPPDANGETKPVTLNELYKQSRLVPLGLRIRLAHELVAALENYHRVGWVHKAISSDNIIFLPRDPSAPVIPYCVRVDQAPTLVDQAPNIVHLASPWLFGFDDSRPDEDATNLRVDHSLGNNIYRHPDRWSIPRMRFTKAHDVYSLGIVLLEIAFWQNAISKADISDPLADSRTHRLAPEKIRDLFVAKCTRQLPHLVGQVFTSAILECLYFQEKTKNMTAYEQHRYFVTNVADGLAKAVGR